MQLPLHYCRNRVRLSLLLEKFSKEPGTRLLFVRGSAIEQVKGARVEYELVGDVNTILVTQVRPGVSTPVLLLLSNDPEFEGEEIVEMENNFYNANITPQIVELVYSKIKDLSKKAVIEFTGSDCSMRVTIDKALSISITGAGGATVEASTMDAVRMHAARCPNLASISWEAISTKGSKRSVSVEGSESDIYRELCALTNKTLVLYARTDSGDFIDRYIQDRMIVDVLTGKNGKSACYKTTIGTMSRIKPYAVILSDRSPADIQRAYRSTKGV